MAINVFLLNMTDPQPVPDHLLHSDDLDNTVEYIASMGWEETPKDLLCLLWLLCDAKTGAIIDVGRYTREFTAPDQEFPDLFIAGRLFRRRPTEASYEGEEVAYGSRTIRMET